MILKNCRYIITQNSARKILENQDILIEDNKIKQIGHDLTGEPVIDCSNKIVMPGLVNTHTHLGMHSLKGMCDDKTLFNWLDKVSAEEKKLTEEQILENTQSGIIECIRNGTTCVYDSYKFAVQRIKIFEKLGMRGLVSSTVTKFKHLKHVNHLIENCKSDMIRPVVAAHSPYRCDEELLRQISAIADKHNLMKRIHIAETRKERDDTISQKGNSSIKYLDTIGFLDKRTLLVHATFVDSEEISLIAHKSASVSHNPISNMKLGSGGVAPVVEMMQKGVTVGLGTDSVVSNNDLDMFEELKITALIHKHNSADPKAMTYQMVLDMGTIDGAKALSIDNLGSIEPGMLADIITLEIAPSLLPMNNVVSNIVYCANGSHVCDSIINGKLVMQDRIID